MLKKLFLILTVVLAVSPLPAYAGDLSIHGFLQGNYSADTGKLNPDGGHSKWSEERGQLRLDVSSEPLHMLIKTDVFHDNMAGKGDGELREGYVDYTGKAWDLRLGRQIVTWGVGDLLFINDSFPKDYEAFFSGRPLEYLKKGVDSVKLGLYHEIASFELIVMPFFEPNNLPDSKRFQMYDPMPGVADREKKEPAANLGNIQWAMRAYRDIAGFDASLYFYRGFFRSPSMRPDSLTTPARITQSFPELSIYGLSLQKSALGGVLSLEGGHNESRADTSGADPFIPNSETRFLAGYQRQVVEDFTVGVQYSGDYMHKYSGYEKNLVSGFPKDSIYRQLASLRLTYFLLNQNLRLSFFSFYGITDRDYLLNPEVKYNFTDNIWGALGANVFGGKKNTTQFGSLDENDNIFLQIRYEL